MNGETSQVTREARGPKLTTRKPIRCDAEGCGRPAMSTVDLRFFCVDHFISHCYERLHHCGPFPFLEREAAAAEAEERFLQDCCDQAANLLRPLMGLDNLDRARLFDILLWASELLTKFQTFKTEKEEHESESGSSPDFANQSEN